MIYNEPFDYPIGTLPAPWVTDGDIRVIAAGQVRPFTTDDGGSIVADDTLEDLDLGSPWLAEFDFLFGASNGLLSDIDIYIGSTFPNQMGVNLTIGSLNVHAVSIKPNVMIASPIIYHPALAEGVHTIGMRFDGTAITVELDGVAISPAIPVDPTMAANPYPAIQFNEIDDLNGPVLHAVRVSQ